MGVCQSLGGQEVGTCAPDGRNSQVHIAYPALSGRNCEHSPTNRFTLPQSMLLINSTHLEHVLPDHAQLLQRVQAAIRKAKLLDTLLTNSLLPSNPP